MPAFGIGNLTTQNHQTKNPVKWLAEFQQNYLPPFNYEGKGLQSAVNVGLWMTRTSIYSQKLGYS